MDLAPYRELGLKAAERYAKTLNAGNANSAAATMLAQRFNHPDRYAIAIVEAQRRVSIDLSSLLETPEQEMAVAAFIGGLYAFAEANPD